MSADTLTATNIISRADQKMRGTTSTSSMSMTVKRPDWQRSISMQTWSKGDSFSLVLITAPPREEGQVFLKRHTNMWNWIPRISRMVKIPPSMMSQSWMGSDFSNNDLLRESSIVTDYEHAKAGVEPVDSFVCWKLKLTPKPQAPVVWTSVHAWIDTSLFVEVKADYFSGDRQLAETMHFSRVRSMDGRMIPTRFTLIPHDKQHHRTVMDIESIDFNVKLDDKFFSKQNARRVHR
ncbi:MAG: outer membrane lipoprotein-sorting protein [Chitinivibrionales bacterium]|nr:outer membrane lipoprotein-sorting protein [Chitinivibrionales bacterium]